MQAEGMVKTATLRGYLQAVAKAFNQVYTTQRLEDFWGMREFYSTVRFVNKALQTDTSGLSPALLMNAILRNYGGPSPHARLPKWLNARWGYHVT